MPTDMFNIALLGKYKKIPINNHGFMNTEARGLSRARIVVQRRNHYFLVQKMVGLRVQIKKHQ